MYRLGVTSTLQRDILQVPWLHVLSNIAPPHLRMEKAAHKMWMKYIEHQNLSHVPLRHDLMNAPPSRLKSRKPIWKDENVHVRCTRSMKSGKHFGTINTDFTNRARALIDMLL